MSQNETIPCHPPPPPRHEFESLSLPSSPRRLKNYNVLSLVTVLALVAAVVIIHQQSPTNDNSQNGGVANNIRTSRQLQALPSPPTTTYNPLPPFHSQQQQEQHPHLNFYNQRHRTLQSTPAPLEGYARGGPVIAVLVSALPKDITELVNALQSLRFLHDADSPFPAPVLVFNEGDLSDEQRQDIVAATDRPLAFPLVDFEDFPEGFDAAGTEASFLVRDRSKWGYYQMIRFWFSRIWVHPAIDMFDTVMRIDSDSCFMEKNSVLPDLVGDDIVYHSQYVGYEPAKETVQGLFDFCVEWMKSVDKMPGNPMMWNFIKTTWEETGTLPVLRTNFEVARKSFMQKRDVYRWLELITEREPFPIFKYRWGDAVLRFLMVAIFAENHMVTLSRPEGYAHKELCDKDNYLARYGRIG